MNFRITTLFFGLLLTMLWVFGLMIAHNVNGIESFLASVTGTEIFDRSIYYFANGNGPDKPKYLIGSADLMPRNLDRRVEVLVEVSDPALQRRLQEVLDISLQDDHLAWILDREGVWSKSGRPSGLDSQRRFQEIALAQSSEA